MKNGITLLAIFLATFAIYAQDPNIIWQRTYGGDQMEYFRDLKQTPDGGYILGGSSMSNISGDKTENSNGHLDMWVIKTNANGEIEWQNTIGGSAPDEIYSIELTPDGGYILAGDSQSNISGDKSENSKGSSDYWIVKLDASGNVEWDKTIGGSDADWLPKISVTNDGYYVCGESWSNISGDKTADSKGESDYWILKLDTLGNILWQKTIGGSGSDSFTSMAVTLDGGCIIRGASESNISGDKTENSRGDYDYWVVKLNSSGVIEWDKTIGGSGGEDLKSVIQTIDNGFLLSGNSSSDISGDKTENSKGLVDFWIVKLDNAGNIQWQNTIGGSHMDIPFAAYQTADGGYMTGGYSRSDISGDKTENSKGGYDFWIVKLNNVGIIEWQKTLGGSETDGIIALTQASDGSYILGGNSSSNISGDKTENSRGGQDFWIIKYAGILGLGENPFATAITLYPNPAKTILQLNTQDLRINQVNIYTMVGSRVMQLDMNSVSPTVDVSSLALGVYYLQLYSGNNVTLKKFVKD